MKVRTTLALLVIAIALGIFVWILDRKSPGTRERLARRAYVVDLDRDDVTQLEIENGDARTRLVKTADGWNLTAPISDRADQRVIDNLLDAAQFLKRDDAITNLGKGEQKRNYLRQFGVLRSHLILRCLGKHTRAELHFGLDTALEGTCYLRVDDRDPVFVTQNDLKNLISKNSDYFRDHQLTPFLPSEVNRILFTQAGGEIELSRQHDEWQILRPIKARADNEAINRSLQQIAGTSILQFLDQEGSGDFDAENAPTSLSLFSEQSKVKIACGPAVPNQPGHIYVRVSDRPSTFIVDESLLRTVDQKPNDLRDRKIIRLNPDLIDRITIMAKGQPITQLSRKQTRWVLFDNNSENQNGASETPAEAEQVNRLIDTLNNSEVSRFVSDSAIELDRYGLERPPLEFAFSSYSSENTAEANAGETRLVTLAIGDSDNEDYYARVEEEPYIVAIPKRLVEQLSTSSLAFRSREILSLQRSELLSVEIKTKDKTTVLTRNGKGQWVVQGPTGKQNDLAVQTFLNTVTSLRALTWALADDSPTVDPGGETVVLHLKNQNPAREITLQMGAPDKQGNRYATISTQPGTFLLSSADFQRLQAALVY
jgi:Domain of unknown function (DUF4340)